MKDALRGKIAIAGVGTTPEWNNPGQTSLDQMAIAIQAAAADAGIGVHEIDGIFTATLSQFMPAMSVPEYLGIRPKVLDGTNIGGSSFVAHLVPAMLSIQAGLCDIACICYGSNQKSAGGKLMTLSEPMTFEAPYKPRNPIGAYAMATARHMHQYGTTRTQLAEVAVAARKWAQLNPEALMRDDLSIEQVLAARMVSDPLSLLDCCLVTDGGGAIILVSAERAKNLAKPPGLCAGRRRGDHASADFADARPDGDRGGRFRPAGLRHGRAGAQRCRSGAALRCLHHQPDPVP